MQYVHVDMWTCLTGKQGPALLTSTRTLQTSSLMNIIYYSLEKVAELLYKVFMALGTKNVMVRLLISVCPRIRELPPDLHV